jgi:hypothetical protein
MGLGYVEGVTHDYIRHGTTTLFAALDVATGKVLHHCKKRHRHQEYLDFLKHIDAHVPPDLSVHLVVDNYGPHKHPRVNSEGEPLRVPPSDARPISSASLPPLLGRGMKPRPATAGSYPLGSPNERLPVASHGAYSPLVK